MKLIKYQIATEVNYGTNEEPKIELLLQQKSIEYSAENEVVAKNEAYKGQITIEDDGQPEPEPIREEKLEAEVSELKEALDLLLSGVTE